MAGSTAAAETVKMNDVALYQQLGELTAEVRAGNRRLDEMLVALNKHVEDDEKVEARVTELEQHNAYYKGALKGMRWFAATAFAVATALGAERLAALIGWHNV